MGKFAIRITSTGLALRLKAKNGEVIAVSEGYAAKASCLGGIESVRKNVEDASIEMEEA